MGSGEMMNSLWKSMVRLNNSLDSLAPLARETQGPPSWSFTRLGRLEACIRPPGAILGAAGSHDVRYGGGHPSCPWLTEALSFEIQGVAMCA